MNPVPVAQPLGALRRQAEDLLRAGRCVRQVSQALGVSYLTVWQWRRSMPRPSTRHRPREGPAPSPAFQERRANAEALLRRGAHHIEVDAIAPKCRFKPVQPDLTKPFPKRLRWVHSTAANLRCSLARIEGS